MVSEIRWSKGYHTVFAEGFTSVFDGRFMHNKAGFANVIQRGGLWYASAYRRLGNFTLGGFDACYWRLHDAKRMVERNFADLDPKFVHPRALPDLCSLTPPSVRRKFDAKFRAACRRERRAGGRRQVRSAFDTMHDRKRRSGSAAKKQGKWVDATPQPRHLFRAILTGSPTSS